MIHDRSINRNPCSCGCLRETNPCRVCSCQPRPGCSGGLPCPPAAQPGFSFSFLKLDACTDTPLEGAVFELIRDGVLVDAAATPASGQITFAGLSPGCYILRETTPPPDYRLNPNQYEITVCPNGMVLVNGDCISCFVIRNFLLDMSAPPQLNTVTTAAVTATGTGIPGCRITLTWPDGTVSTTTVNVEGTWGVSKPSALILNAGDLIRANQTCIGLRASADVYTGVVPAAV